MNQHKRNRLNWIDAYGEDFQSILNDESLTRTERVDALNKSNIPTLSNRLGKWTLSNVYQVSHRYFQ
jgi:hypothetical protein